MVSGLPRLPAPDIIARLIGQRLSERSDQQFVIENRPGAGSDIGTEIVVKAPPDGYTLLWTAAANATNATLYPDLNFNFIRDIAPVAAVGRTLFVMIVNPSVPAKTVPEFIAYAKANPGKISMTSQGSGTAPHVFGEYGAAVTQCPLRAKSIRAQRSKSSHRERIRTYYLFTLDLNGNAVVIGDARNDHQVATWGLVLAAHQLADRSDRINDGCARRVCHETLQRRDLMGRPPYGARTACKSCKSIDVRKWHREGRLSAGQHFTNSWTFRGEPAGTINVRTEPGAVVLTYRTRSWQAAEWRTITQRVPIEWSGCRFGGRRPWFICPGFCDGRCFGRRVAVLYGPREYFACRQCYGLVYASQQESLRERGLLKAQKILIRLGAKPDLFEPFPEKPPRMHWRTYERQRRAYEIARDRCIHGVLGRVPRVERDLR